jgi:hypothetical protein
MEITAVLEELILAVAARHNSHEGDTTDDEEQRPDH